MPLAVGIDLGTTNAVLAVYLHGQVRAVRIDGSATMPAVVSFRADGPPLVGLPAKARMLIDPEHTVSSAKRFLGNRTYQYDIGYCRCTPVDITTYVLKALVERAQVELHETIDEAVVTIPAYFTAEQREDTLNACTGAGLKVLRLLPEPTAAAIAYTLNRGNDQRVMVYHLGGGTFDV